MTIVRSLLVLVIGGLLAIQVVRSAVVALPFMDRLGLADRYWPGHPQLLLEQSMAEIGIAAATGRPVSAATTARVDEAAAKSPLSVEPFLIRGAIAQTVGRRAEAEMLYRQARDLDPRSIAARYFLADVYFRSNRIADGLVEMAALARLQPAAAAPFLPALVAYARTPGAIPQLRQFFRSRPDLEPDVLSILSRDGRNAELVLTLASPVRGNPRPEWHGRLVQSLVKARQYDKAQSVWARLSGRQVSEGLFNPGFEEIGAPPPFNWTYSETGDGVAEPTGEGRLDVLYYSRARTLLAYQLLSLRPGRYSLAMELEGETDLDGLQWAIRCANRDQKLLRLPLRGPNPRGDFTVPSDCPAQWLELRGEPADLPRTIDLTVSRLRLVAAVSA